jgi:hypothetical protein
VGKAGAGIPGVGKAGANTLGAGIPRQGIPSLSGGAGPSIPSQRSATPSGLPSDATTTPDQTRAAQRDPQDDQPGTTGPARYFDPHPSNPATRPPEPGDVPVWPPLPPAEEQRPEGIHPEPRHPEPRFPETKHPETKHPETKRPEAKRAETKRAGSKRPEEKRPPEERPQDKRPEEGRPEERLPDLPFNQDTWGQKPGTALDLPTPPQGSPTFPPGAFKQPPFYTQPPPPPIRPGKSKRALLVTLGALALAGVATGGFFAYKAMTTTAPPSAAAGPQPTAAPLPSVEVATSPPADIPGMSMLNSEQTDPQKLSLTEVFPKKKVTAAGATFTRVKTDVESSCEKAATGAFADALREQKCSRIVRATYVDSKRRYAVTTGIAVLPTKDAAAVADQAKNLSRNIWFRALPGAAGTGAERVHIAGGYAAGLVWGRYIVFSYATHADGHTPVAKDKTLVKVSGAFRDQTSLVLERRITKG